MDEEEELLDCLIRIDKYIVKINAKLVSLHPPYWIENMIVDNLHSDENIMSITYET